MKSFKASLADVLHMSAPLDMNFMAMDITTLAVQKHKSIDRRKYRPELQPEQSAILLDKDVILLQIFKELAHQSKWFFL